MYYSPDGKKIVSCAEDETIKVWDAKDGVLINTLEDH